MSQQTPPFDHELWQDLCRLTRRPALFDGGFVFRTLPQGAFVERGWVQVFGSAALGVLGALFMAAGWKAWLALTARSFFFAPSVLACGAIGTGLWVLAIINWLTRPCLWWNDGEDGLWIRFGRVAWAMRTIYIPRGQVGPVLALQKEADWHEIVRPAASVLLLRRVRDGAQEAKLAIVEDRAELAPLHEAMAAFLGSPPADDTLVTLDLPAGQSVQVSLAPLTKAASGSVVKVDQRRRMLTVRSGWLRWGRKTDIGFDAVAAVQICSQWIHGSGDSADQLYFELNLVPLAPDEPRINLTRSQTESRIREDARALADLLGKPLLDHSAV